MATTESCKWKCFLKKSQEFLEARGHEQIVGALLPEPLL